MIRISKLFILFWVIFAPAGVQAAETDSIACPAQCFKCFGDANYGGPCYAGYGGPVYAGYGGNCYAGYGGPAYAGYGGNCYAGYPGPLYDGPGGNCYGGYDGPVYEGYGGACYAGFGGPCNNLENDRDSQRSCPTKCIVCKYSNGN